MPPPAFSDWRGWVGAGRWEAMGAPLLFGCLQVSRGIQRGAMFSQRSALGERKMAKEVLGHLLVHCQTVITSSPAGYIPGGWGGIPLLSPEPQRFTNLQCFLLLPEHFQSIFYVLITSLGNRCY